MTTENHHSNEFIKNDSAVVTCKSTNWLSIKKNPICFNLFLANKRTLYKLFDNVEASLLTIINI